MTSNTRQRKSRLSDDHSTYVKNWNLSNNSDIIDVVLLSLKNLKLRDELDIALGRIDTNNKKSGRRVTKFETRKKFWDFYHDNATPSTITSRPAKLKLSERNKIQTGLNFVDTTNIIIMRGKEFYENIWMMLHTTYKELYQKFINTHPDHLVSIGTFFSLKPFYIRTETEKDIEMCCCMLHLHARWLIGALIESAEKQSIAIPFSCYNTFFHILTEKCETSPTTYIPWVCTLNKKTFCNEITEIWKELSQSLLNASDKNVFVHYLHFEMVESVNRKGEPVSHLKPVMKSENIECLLEEMHNILPNILNHRNHLRHYRNTVKFVRDNFDAVFIDIDFSENLTLPVKYEPQSLHWNHDLVSVHSGIVKIHGEKSYHPYVSDDRKHDQKFVKLVLEKMLDTVETMPEICVIESDNCTSQYKSAQHFEDIQEICNSIEVPIIRLFSVACHGKGEVDHVGGLAKVAIRRFIGAGGMVLDADDCLAFLTKKFEEKTNPKFYCRKISVSSLNEARTEARLKKYPTIEGSTLFQVMVFKPNSPVFKVARRLCICEDCMNDYGSCPLFESFELRTGNLKKIYLRSSEDPEPSTVDIAPKHNQTEFLLPDT